LGLQPALRPRTRPDESVDAGARPRSVSMCRKACLKKYRLRRCLKAPVPVAAARSTAPAPPPCRPATAGRAALAIVIDPLMHQRWPDIELARQGGGPLSRLMALCHRQLRRWREEPLQRFRGLVHTVSPCL